MNNLFLRIYSRMLVVTILVCLGGLFAFNELSKKRDLEYTKSQLSGVMALIKNGLNRHEGDAQQEWFKLAIKATGLNMKLSNANNQSPDHYSVSLVNSDLKHVEYSINDSQLISFEFQGFNRQLFEGVNNFILNELGQTPPPLREHQLNKIKEWFVTDIGLIHRDKLALTDYEKAQLDINKIVVYRFNQSDGITTFSQFGKSPMILKVGPVEHFNPYPMFWIFILTIFVLIVSLITGWFLFKPFASRLKKLAEDVNNVAILDKLGNTSLDITISQQGDDALSVLTQEVDQMAKRVITLVKDQQQLSRSISHEFRTPIVKMGYRIAMLEESNQLTSHHAQTLKVYMTELHNLVDELLLYSSLEFNPTTESKQFNLFALCTSLKNDLEPLSRSNINIQCPQGIYILGIEQYWKTILQNLLTNAQRYAKSKIDILVLLDEKQLTVTVSDDGIGIQQQNVKNIFEPFFVEEQSRNKKMAGHGLGLSIVQRMTLLQKGKIEARNNTQGGAQFNLTFDASIAQIKQTEVK
ncbi:ATP-binding protein [Marinicellulosiphila megalodicopiae]|uniref:ATP-binding protein n=1 Tax=Marinicellulosiphila megalodicopiae TaxID=2724896 RepID=UPI003BAFCA56